MRKTQLKAVEPRAKTSQLSYDEIKRLTERVVTFIEQDDEARDCLLVLASQVMEHCDNMLHVETIGMILAGKLYAAANDRSEKIIAYSEERRRKVTGRET